jgi:hypothetical protein
MWVFRIQLFRRVLPFLEHFFSQACYFRWASTSRRHRAVTLAHDEFASGLFSEIRSVRKLKKFGFTKISD